MGMKMLGWMALLSTLLWSSTGFSQECPGIIAAHGRDIALLDLETGELQALGRIDHDGNALSYGRDAMLYDTAGRPLRLWQIDLDSIDTSTSPATIATTDLGQPEPVEPTTGTAGPSLSAASDAYGRLWRPTGSGMTVIDTESVPPVFYRFPTSGHHEGNDIAWVEGVLYSVSGKNLATLDVADWVPGDQTEREWIRHEIANRPDGNTGAVNSIALGPDGDLYIGASRNLWRYQAETDTLTLHLRMGESTNDFSGCGAFPDTCGDGIVQSSEQCDEGDNNGETTCGCQNDCSYTSAGTLCLDDELFCNGTETCDGLGACLNDGEVCTEDVCDEEGERGVDCLESDDCGADEQCQDGMCQPGESECSDCEGCIDDGDCAEDEVCSELGECEPERTGLCVLDRDCRDGEVCSDLGSCIAEEPPECVADTDCAADEICYGDGTCGAESVGAPGCQDDDDCGEHAYCENTECIAYPVEEVDCSSDVECTNALVCHRDLGICTECDPTSGCADGRLCHPDGWCMECLHDDDCGSGVCDADLTCVECLLDENCDDGFECSQNLCIALSGTAEVDTADEVTESRPTHEVAGGGCACSTSDSSGGNPWPLVLLGLVAIRRRVVKRL